jgi:hypothetical protein
LGCVSSVQHSFFDRLPEVAHAAGERHRQAVARGHHSEQHLNIGKPPSAQRRRPLHEHPPEHKEREVIEHHEQRLDDERSAQRQRGFHVGRDQRARKPECLPRSSHRSPALQSIHR